MLALLDDEGWFSFFCCAALMLLVFCHGFYLFPLGCCIIGLIMYGC